MTSLQTSKLRLGRFSDLTGGKHADLGLVSRGHRVSAICPMACTAAFQIRRR